MYRVSLALLAVAAPACSQPATDTPQSEPARADVARVETRGLDAATMASTVAAAERLPRLHSMVIARHGQTIAEHRFRGPSLDTPVNIKSASKTILATLTGIAIERGVLTGADQKIAPVLRTDLPANPDPRLADIDVGDLLSMRAGLDRTSGANYGAWVASPNWVRYALARPFVDEPGGRMLYSTGTSHLMSAVLTRASGRSTHALANDWLAQPLGIRIPEWPRDAQGVYFGGNDMLMSPKGLLRFGEMIRQGGTIDGRRVVPADWIETSWQSRGSSPWSGNGYGYGWFTKQSGGHNVPFAWGYGGQMLFIVPDLSLTVVMISDPSPHPRAESHLPELHALLDQGIVPAAIAGAGGA